MKNREKIFIIGMHCASCEILVAGELRKISTVKTHKISHKKGFAEISYNSTDDLKKIATALEGLNYRITGSDTPSALGAYSTPSEPKKSARKKTLTDYAQIATIFFLLISVGLILERINIYQYFPNIGQDLSIAAAFLLGLIASVSTCLALVGGIVISFGSSYDLDGNKRKFWTYAKPHVFFHIGRMLAFILLGGILGTVGSAIGFSLGFTSYLTIFVAVIMLYIGLHILGFLPNITRLGFHLPSGLSKKIHTLQEAEHSAAPFVIGALTFFLPCGFTQSAQLAAVASGSFASGALIMGFFALGTVPVLLGLGMGSSRIQKLKSRFFKYFIGVLIIFFGLYSLNSGLRLMGADFSLDLLSTETQEETSGEIVITEDGYQEVNMAVDWLFEPSYFTIKKDVPVRWIIEAENFSGCTSEIIIPELSKRYSLQKGTNVFEFTPTKTGNLVFSCWMGMVGGKFNVVD